MNDYERIAQVIRHLNQHHREQPSLAQLAELVGLSEGHFHRLFKRWAGVTPKDFLQCLTAEYARSRLVASASVLETALETGLSGPGRLHDLMVSLEAASPGEIKTGGTGLEMRWGRTDSPFGTAVLGWTSRGISHLSFSEDGLRPNGEPPELIRHWPNSRRILDNSGANKIARQIFNREPGVRMPITALVRGTEFQLRVWRALLRIPAGSLASYGRVAELIGDPRAARAVGTACGSNLIGFLIPCHRVIRETGIVEGYRWGAERKKAILAWEAAN